MSALLGKPAEMTELLGVAWPARFGPLETERAALERGAALFDFSSSPWLTATGSDVASFLQGMVTQDVAGMQPGEARPGWLLDANGKIVSLLRFLRLEPRRFLIQTPPHALETVRAALERYIIMEDARLTPAPELATLSLQGPRAEALLDEAWQAGETAWRSRHDRCGYGGFDLIGEPEQLRGLADRLRTAGATPAGMIALNEARIRAFIPWFGVDMKPGQNPVIFGAADRIAARKGCYVGQELVAMTRDRGRPPQLLSLLRGEGPAPAKSVALLTRDKSAGDIVSAIDIAGGALALATVKYQFAEPGAALSDAEGGNWVVEKTSDYKAN